MRRASELCPFPVNIKRVKHVVRDQIVFSLIDCMALWHTTYVIKEKNNLEETIAETRCAKYERYFIVNA